MKKLIVLLILLFPIIVFAQQEIEELVKSKSYVIEAFRVSDNKGNSRSSAPSASFISINSSDIVVQWIDTDRTNNNYQDFNGMGGYTVEGTIYEYDITTEEKKKGVLYSVKMKCDMKKQGFYTVVITANDSGNGQANIDRNTSDSVHPTVIRLTGKIKSLKEANISKGRVL